MKKIEAYECEYCKKLFRTPNRHDCKFNPAKRNCFSCGNLKGWLESVDGVDTGMGILRDPNFPDCEAGIDGWDIEDIKSVNYNMQCEGWKARGQNDWKHLQGQKTIDLRQLRGRTGI